MGLKACELKDFARLRDQLAEVIAGEVEIFKTLNRNHRATELAKSRSDLLEERFRIVFMGAMKDGKSTLINALLGEELLPAMPGVACTAIPISVRYGEKKSATCYRKSEEAPLTLRLPLDIAEFWKAVTIPPKHQRVGPDDDAWAIMAHPFHRAEVFAPIELLNLGVELQDSPGLNENTERTEITWERVNRSDAVVIVLNSREVDRESDRNDIKRILESDRDPRVVFVAWNQIDEIRNNAVAYERVTAEGKLLVKSFAIPEDHVFFVSAKEALEGRTKNLTSLIACSGVEQFEFLLGAFLAAEGTAAKLLTPLIVAETALNDAMANVHAWRHEGWVPVDQANHAEQEARKAFRQANAIRERQRISNERTADHLRLEVSKAVKKLLESLVAGVADAVEAVPMTSMEALKITESRERLVSAAKSWVGERWKKWEKEELIPLLDRHRAEIQRQRTLAVGELEDITQDIARHEEIVREAIRRFAIASDGHETIHSVANAAEGFSITETEIELPLGGFFLGAIFGSVFGVWMIAIFAAPAGIILAAALIGAAMLGIINLADKLKEQVIGSIRKSIQAGSDQLEATALERVDHGWKQICDNVLSLLNDRFAIIEQYMARIEQLRLEAERRATERNTASEQLESQLAKSRVKLLQLRREIDPLQNEKHLADEVVMALHPRLQSMEDNLRAADNESVAAGEPRTASLKAILGEEGCIRLRGVQSLFENLGRWRPPMERELLLAWADCRKCFENTTADVQETAFQAISAISISEGAPSFPEPKEVRKRYLDDSFRTLLVQVCKIVRDEEFARDFGNDELGVIGKRGHSFCKAYERALVKIEPQRFKARWEPGTIIDGRLHRDSPKGDEYASG